MRILIRKKAISLINVTPMIISCTGVKSQFLHTKEWNIPQRGVQDFVII